MGELTLKTQYVLRDEGQLALVFKGKKEEEGKEEEEAGLRKESNRNSRNGERSLNYVSSAVLVGNRLACSTLTHTAPGTKSTSIHASFNTV